VIPPDPVELLQIVFALSLKPVPFDFSVIPLTKKLKTVQLTIR